MKNRYGCTHVASAAFSLVELSIVLVILGLLIGGILSGQALIRAAELRAVTTEYQRYATAIHTFRDKYFALPGDMRNATAFWNSAGGDGFNLACTAVATTLPTTCNGNGDGSIWSGGDTISETYRAWEHMANAGLIEGTYTGAADTAGYADATRGINQPASKLSQGAWTLWTIYSWGTFGKAGTSLWLGADIVSGQAYSFYPLLTPEEAWNIDTKTDDGRPGYGKITTTDSANSYGPACTGSATASTAQYQLNNTAKLCNQIFWLE
jgi:type II secretory pathway pseudopilin PulG